MSVSFICNQRLHIRIDDSLKSHMVCSNLRLFIDSVYNVYSRSVVCKYTHAHIYLTYMFYTNFLRLHLIADCRRVDSDLS